MLLSYIIYSIPFTRRSQTDWQFFHIRILRLPYHVFLILATIIFYFTVHHYLLFEGGRLLIRGLLLYLHFFKHFSRRCFIFIDLIFLIGRRGLQLFRIVSISSICIGIVIVKNPFLVDNWTHLSFTRWF